MKIIKLYILIVQVFIGSPFAFSQVADTIYVVYEPFEVLYHPPKTLTQLEARAYTDTITNEQIIFAIMDKYNQVIALNEIKRLQSPQGVKIVCKVSYNGQMISKFYYLGGRVLNSNGITYEKDLGLLNIIMNAIDSDELYKKELEELMEKHKHK